MIRERHTSGVRPILCLITDRHRDEGDWRGAISARVHAAARAGVQLVQVRERDLDGLPLLELVRDCVAAVRGTTTRVVVNDRTDVALAAGAHGVHLRADSVPAAAVRRIARRPFLVGRSVHAVQEAVAAAADGLTDYLLFGTVFDSSSKPDRRPAGVEALRVVANAVTIPVLAVGGVTRERLPTISNAGAAGAAGISLFLP